MKLMINAALSGTLMAVSSLTCAGIVAAQENAPSSSTASAKDSQQAAPAPVSAVRLTLEDALARARKNSTQFQAALTDSGIARQDRFQAGAALLPSVTYNNQAIYTKSAANAPIFIANNGTHEYLSQANVHESIDLAGVSNFRRASAAAAVARAKAEIASRGLVVTVVQNYYAVAAAQQKLVSAQKASQEGDSFFKLTQDLERGGEVAHSDVIKAELQAQERRRQLLEAQLTLLNAKLNLAVLIFPDFNDNYEVADDLHAPIALPTFAEVQQRAARDNPDVRAALETVHAASADVT
jgi:outer membrane protein TolC